MLNPRYSITTKLLLLFLIVGISSFLTVGIYSFYSAKRALYRRTLDQLISVRAFKKQQLESFFLSEINLLTMAGEQWVRDKTLPAGGEVLFSDLFLLKRDSSILHPGNHPNPLEKKDPGRMKQIIKQMLAGNSDSEKPVVSDLFLKNQRDTLSVCLIGIRLTSAHPDDCIAIFAEISEEEINRIMLQDNRRIGLGQSGEVYLAGQDMRMRSASRFIRNATLNIPVGSEAVRRALHGEAGEVVTSDYRGVRVLSAFEPLDIPGLHWAILAEIDYEEAMVPVTGLRNDILLVSVVLFIFILGFARLISKMVTHPIIRLKQAAAKLGSGDFNQSVPVTSADEIGSLAASFNTMAEQILEERRKRFQALFDGQEMERRRISRELHDGLGQKLVGTKLQLENCDEQDLFCLQKTMSESKRGLHSSVEELRRISNDLMPAALDELGLETALRNLCRETEKQSGLEVLFESTVEQNPGPVTAVYLFRIVQEGIQNILKHARASRIVLELIETREFLMLILEDNGVGFRQVDAVKGNGLFNMRERAILLGGTFSIESEPGHGTTLRIKIPLSL